MDDFERRAQERKARMTLTKSKLGDPSKDPIIKGAEGISLVHQLTKISYAWSGQEIPQLTRTELPYRFIPDQRS